MSKPAFQTIEEARLWASVFLRDHKREEKVADILLEHVLDLSFAMLLASGRDPFPEECRNPFIQSVREHAETGVPVQHLTGYGHFYGRDFRVNPHVLIPRPETEELVFHVLEWLSTNNLEKPTIVDAGTGSGAIAITLALEAGHTRVVATDLSSQALKTAEENARHLGASLSFLQGNFLEAVKDQEIDILVSNPPYISYEERSEMDDTVVHFDPELALFAENDGLAAYQTIVNQLKEFEQSPDLIAFEIGHEQGKAVTDLIRKEFPHYTVEVKKDINQKDRIVLAEKK